MAREVGMAAIDKNTGRVMLIQVRECAENFQNLWVYANPIGF